MSKRKPIKDCILTVISDRREQLEKEKQLYEEKMHSTQVYYGCGGPYMRQEAAMEKREKEIKELNEFESQILRYKPIKKLRVYAFGCRSCGSACMSTSKPFSDWHECPVCRKMIHLSDVPSKELEVTERSEMGEWLKRVIQGGSGE